MNWIWSILVNTFLTSSLAFGIQDKLSGNVKGKLVFHQMEGNSTYLRNRGNLASSVPTVVSFELSDPQHIMRAETFMYTWDLGNGEVIKSLEAFVKFGYTTPGNYTFKLSIESNAPQHSKLTGMYSVDLTVLDIIRSVELRGPLIVNVGESSSLSFQIGGSPPVWLCWRVLSDCHMLSPDSCNFVRLQGNMFNLSYTFRSVGTYCFKLTVRNNISKFQTSYNIYVQGSPASLFFILPCIALIVSSLIFISVTVCRPRQQSLISKALGAKTNYRSFTDIELLVKDATIPIDGDSPAVHSYEASSSSAIVNP